MTTFYRDDNADTLGTSFHDVEIFASLNRLTELFGSPIEGDGYKTNFEWIFEADDGTVITVYDYKYSGAAEGHWHVGGHDRRACLKFARWFNNLE